MSARLARGRPLREAAVVLYFLALAAFATRPLCLHLADETLAGPDPIIDLYTVNWLAGHLLQPSRLFGGNVFWPAPHPVLLSDLSLGSAVLVAPLRPLVGDPVPLYNVALMLALAFGGWAFCALARALTGRLTAGLLTGTLAAFGSHQLYHVYHLNLLTTGWLALLLVGLHGIASRPRPAAVLLAGFAFALSAQSSGYYAVAAVVLALVFAAFHARRLLDPVRLRAVVAAAALGILLTAPYALTYEGIHRDMRLRRPIGMSRHMAYHPLDDLGSQGYLDGALLGQDGERLFPGFLALGLAAVTLRRRPSGTALYAGLVAVLLLLSLGPDVELFGRALPLPYRALFSIPPLDGMRHPYTFAAVAWMALAVLAGLGLAALKAARRPAIGALAVALAVAETAAPGPELRDVPPGVPPAYSLALDQPRGPLFEVPVSAPDAMLWAARHGREVVNGDGAFVPPRHAVLQREIQKQWIDQVPQDLEESSATWILLKEFPAHYVILPVGRHPALWRLIAPFDRSRLFRFVGQASDGDRVYAARPEALREAAGS